MRDFIKVRAALLSAKKTYTDRLNFQHPLGLIREVALNAFTVLNHISEVSKSGQALKAKTVSDLAILGQNLDQKIVLLNPHGYS